MLGLCVALTLCQQLGDGFAVVLRAVTLLSSELLISGFHALLKTTHTAQCISVTLVWCYHCAAILSACKNKKKQTQQHAKV